MLGPVRRLREWSAKINGELIADAPLAERTTFRAGGPADLLARPVDESDVTVLLRLAADAGVPVTVLGGGSNILISDRGIRGLVIDATSLSSLEETDSGVRAGAGTPMSDTSAFAANHEQAGLAFIYAMPGSVGGAVWMNARCYGGEIYEILESVRLIPTVDENGEFAAEVYRPVAADFGYKRSPFMARPAIMTSVSFRLRKGQREPLWNEMREHETDRRAKGHFAYPCAGSVFKNNRAFGKPSGALLDGIGMRGFSIGNARVSDQHANIVQNTGGATASEIRAVIEHMARAAREKLGLELEREVLYVGDWEES